MGVRIKDFFRNLATGAGISGRTVSLKRAVDDVEIASTTTGSDGSFTFTDSDFTYRGEVYYGVDDGTRFKVHSGASMGQVGILWIDDLLRTLDQLGVGIVNGLAVSGGNGNMNLTVAAGAAILKDGALYGPASSQSVTITAADVTNPRIDSVVIRGTRRGETEEGNANLVVIAGTPAGVPTAPALTQTSATWDVWLADVLVDAGVTLIASNKVTDRRTYSVRLTPPVGDTGDILTVENGIWTSKAATSAGATISVSGNGSSLSSAINTLDFSSAFNATIDPTNEANIAIATNGITAVMLGPGAVTSSKITAGAVGTAAIADGAITTAKITDANVTDAKIATGISAAKLGAGTVDNTKLGYLSGVTSAVQTQLDAKFAKTGGTLTGPLFSSYSGTFNGGASLGILETSVVSLHGHLRLVNSGAIFGTTLGAAAGTGGSVGASRIRGSDTAGEVQIITGSSGVSAGTLVTVDFADARPDTDYIVVFQPTSINASDLNLSLGSRTTDGFAIRANTAPSTGETLNIAFLVIETNAA